MEVNEIETLKSKISVCFYSVYILFYFLIARRKCSEPNCGTGGFFKRTIIETRTDVR
jgi:hypothetical protein